jgi:hypothetical protein
MIRVGRWPVVDWQRWLFVQLDQQSLLQSSPDRFTPARMQDKYENGCVEQNGDRYSAPIQVRPFRLFISNRGGPGHGRDPSKR